MFIDSASLVFLLLSLSENRHLPKGFISFLDFRLPFDKGSVSVRNGVTGSIEPLDFEKYEVMILKMSVFV